MSVMILVFQYKPMPDGKEATPRGCTDFSALCYDHRPATQWQSSYKAGTSNYVQCEPRTKLQWNSGSSCNFSPLTIHRTGIRVGPVTVSSALPERAPAMVTRWKRGEENHKSWITNVHKRPPEELTTS